MALTESQGKLGHDSECQGVDIQQFYHFQYFIFKNMKHPDHKLSFADIKIKIRIYMSNLIFFPDKQFLCHVNNFDNSICSQYQISKSVILIVSLMVITSFLLFLHQFPVGIYLLKVNKVRNMFKVNNKDARTTPLASLWCLY